ncbi:MAG: bifunctional glutamate N-acetyltransferase/amino-acid acetyltransferase ArgJ [Nitrospirota bacterium]|nr:bifunctional glutamate N-acetyltransferase/amino-acid acetyltransferase ArgJ [Nitrospirota bacterium]
MKKSSAIKVPQGFFFSVAEAAIKKPGRKDFALIFSEVESTVAGTFTTNTVKAAPVLLCMQKIKAGKGQAIIVNSGNANACTGKQGMKDARDIVAVASQQLSIGIGLTYICSTGVIGTPMPMQRIVPAIGPLAGSLGNATFDDIAKAIMTTDTFPKIISRQITINNKQGTIAGICKGAGMIAPNMATMLCFILTDIAVEKKTLHAALKSAVGKSFNRITIDGDMSTNDTALIMANGVLGNKPVTKNSSGFSAFQKALDELCYELSKLIVKDGEGATKLVEVIVKNAKNEKDAERAALAIANSSLVKTAIYGNDANWGRIMAALGYSKAKFDPDKADIFFNKVQVVNKGVMNNKDKEATEEMKKKELKITVDLHAGRASVKVLTCDLTEDYIRINAEYRT